MENLCYSKLFENFQQSVIGGYQRYKKVDYEVKWLVLPLLKEWILISVLCVAIIKAVLIVLVSCLEYCHYYRRY